MWWDFRQDRYRFFRSANLAVSSSRWEGLLNVILEALANGARVVATNCSGGTAEILTSSSLGILVPVNDVEGLALGMRRGLADTCQLNDADLVKLLGQFDETAVVANYAELLAGEEVERSSY